MERKRTQKQMTKTIILQFFFLQNIFIKYTSSLSTSYTFKLKVRAAYVFIYVRINISIHTHIYIYKLKVPLIVKNEPILMYKKTINDTFSHILKYTKYELNMG